MNKTYSIFRYDFNSSVESKLIQDQHNFLSWPIVYFLDDIKVQDAYVGETTDVINRLKTHLKNDKKQQLSSVHLILSELFNKSAALDLEAYLIRYISADGQYKLQNGNLGISNHKYYQQKEIYWSVFKDIWNELRSLGIARHSLEHIDNSDMFKYSPYKSLSIEQIDGLKMILNCLLDDRAKTCLMQGGAGTGKSILAIFLFKLLKTNLEDFNFSDFEEKDQELFELVEKIKSRYVDVSMALVIPMASFRKTIKNVFKNIKGLSPNMVIGPSDLAKQHYDLLIVDEGHRLRRRVNLGPYFKPFDNTAEKLGLDKFNSSELDWVLSRSKKNLIFYDRFQSIKPSDVLRERFLQLESDATTRIETLKNQFRCRGGIDYVNFIHAILDGKVKNIKPFYSVNYDVRLFDKVDNLVKEIKLKESQEGLSKLIAGYAWKWVSKKDKSQYDIIIDDVKLQWNSITIDWINSPDSINEVGCIHTTQGYDLNYAGIIIGPELDYDFDKEELVIYKNHYKDKAGKNTITNELVLKDFIINIYKTILLRGIKGTFIYACNPSMQRYLTQFLSVHNKGTQKSATQIIDTPNRKTIKFYDLKIAAGTFSEQQQLEIIRYIELKESITDHENYFACRVIGESMNKIIPNNSICLFEKYSGGSRNGRIVLVEMTDFTDADSGSNYTIKEYSSKKIISEDGWRHEEILLMPKSNEDYQPIILRDEETIRLKIIGLFVRVLE
jgi:DUF2075 family protein/SOS-response transcriptional repressor LexA/predicted GIY-YIG superfamily endonuclease